MSGISTFQNIYFYSREVINNEVPQNEKKTLVKVLYFFNEFICYNTNQQEFMQKFQENFIWFKTGVAG